MYEMRPVVLSIAGFDPCGGAGVLADVKTLERLKAQGMAVVTASTIQTENRFISIQWQNLEMIKKSIETLMQHYTIKAVKIGVVKDFTFLKSIVDVIRAVNPNVFVVWDSVLKSSSGFTFFNKDDFKDLPKVLVDIDLVTPNFNEYQLLKPFFTKANNVLIKGGHRTEKIGIDILMIQGKKIEIHPKDILLYPKHGSGCVLSSAIAAHISLGANLETACRLGKKYVEQYLKSHPSLLGYHYD